jgi:serine/threonine/tyrosine-interacting protein
LVNDNIYTSNMNMNTQHIIAESAMSDDRSRHLKADEYVFRMPTPPRIVIPPLGNWNHTTSAYNLSGIVSHSDLDINIDFLQGTGYDSALATATGGAAANWKYEHRRQAQEILSFLWLGPLHAARDKEFLQREGINLIIAIQHKVGIGSKLTIGAMRVANELGIAKATLDVGNNQDLIALFPTATRIINSHLRELYNRAMLNPAGGIPPGKALIFCESGNEKSAAVAAAYLMDNFQGVDYIKACQICNARRFCCSFDDSIKQYLKSYDDILQAKRSVAAASPPPQTPSPGISYTTNPLFGAPAIYSPQPQSAATAPILGGGKPKRARARDDDDEMEMDGAPMEDADRFVGREFAPFR